MLLTYKFRLRDKHSAELNRQARAVNIVWNYCNETQQKAARAGRKWLGWSDLQKLTAGTSAELNIHAHTIQQVCRAYDKSRRFSKKPWLRFRGCKSLGWVPFNKGTVSFDGEAFVFRQIRYIPMHARDDIPVDATLCSSSFNRDARGRWHINVLINVETSDRTVNSCVGIDLGIKELATLSNGEKIEMPSFFRGSEVVLAAAQRAKKSKRARAIHAKIANRRKDYLHKASTKITKEFGLIVIGDVSPSQLSRTIMAKSVLDAGWSDFKRMLSYKSIRNGGSTLEVSERFTSQTCSSCGSLPPSRPKGIAGLRNRTWQCDDCGTVHDRDVNAARNILAIGLDSLAGGAE
jgi:putative transposase